MMATYDAVVETPRLGITVIGTTLWAGIPHDAFGPTGSSS